MKVFVTGGSGFIGGHVIERLAPEHRVLAMARSERSAAKVRAFGAEPLRASLSDIAPEHLEGVDAVVHCAAFVEEWGTREQFFEANVLGTQRVLEAARAAGVARFVHISTEATLFDGTRDLVGVDEDEAYPERQRFLYSETKAEAERRVLAQSDTAMTTVAIRPRLVWGPRDTSVLPAVLRMAEEGSWVWLDAGRHRTSTTHVTNLAHAVALALTEGEGGRVYFVADEGTRTIRELLEALAATRGVTLPGRSLPGWLARSLARGVELVWRLVGARSTPPMTHFAVAMMSRTVTVETARARRELGYRPVIGFEEGVAALGTERTGAPPTARAATLRA